MAMVLSDVKEVVRTNIGKRDIEPHVLDYIIASGRREIEKENNWYYMRRALEFNLTVDIQAYEMGENLAINEANFKDMRMLMYRNPTGNRFFEVPSGDRNQLDLLYTTDQSSRPQRYTIDDEGGTLKLLVYPAQPDQAYVMRMLYYVWTENPTSDTGTDELIRRWPELLIFSASAQGFHITTKEEELAKPWEAKMAQELMKLKRYDWFRRESEKNMIFPARGPHTQGSDVSIEGRKIFW